MRISGPFPGLYTENRYTREHTLNSLLVQAVLLASAVPSLPATTQIPFLYQILVGEVHGAAWVVVVLVVCVESDLTNEFVDEEENYVVVVGVCDAVVGTVL